MAVGCSPSVPVEPVTLSPVAVPKVLAADPPQPVRAGAMRVAFPAGWALRCATTGETKARAVAPPVDGVAVMTLDVPVLPFHLPGLIPVGLVADGYADDVRRKLMPDAAGPPPSDVAVPDARAERVTRTGHDAAGRATVDDAVVIVHGDAVYVLAIDADPVARPAAEAALAAAVASVTWGR